MTSNNVTPLKVVLVAGEASGDILGAGLIKSLKVLNPNIEFCGIGGFKMQQEGLHSWFNIDELSVMGLVEVIKHLPSLLQIKKKLVAKTVDFKPDIYIGIDAPDFNLRVEKEIKALGIPTVQYVSPSIWAWRQKRIYKIAKATNLVLSLFPFEKKFYDDYKVPCKFVGHTLADSIPLSLKQSDALEQLKLDKSKKWIAVMPGSRKGEIDKLAPLFINTCKIISKRNLDINFIVPMINEARKSQFISIWKEQAPDLKFCITDNSSLAMQAADSVLLASGTAALEAMLIKRPMVVAYKLHWLTYKLANKLVKVKSYSLPNLLAESKIVPELIQDNCTAENLAIELEKLLGSDNAELLDKFNKLHILLKKNADEQAALEIMNLIKTNQFVNKKNNNIC